MDIVELVDIVGNGSRDAFVVMVVNLAVGAWGQMLAAGVREQMLAQ